MASPAPAAKALLDSATRLFPGRSKASDGLCPSAAHTARSPTSYHEPGPDGLCSAADLTHDPAAGCDCNVLAKVVILDPRCDEAIWNRQIWTRNRQAESWRPYSGSNPHTKHLHVSVNRAKNRDASPWFSRLMAQAEPKGEYVVPQLPSPPVQLPGGKMRQLVTVGPLDASGKGWAQTSIPFAGFEAATVNAVNPEQSGYGPAVICHAMNWDDKVRIVVHNGRSGDAVGVYVTTAP